jgi:hypothetical protein
MMGFPAILGTTKILLSSLEERTRKIGIIDNASCGGMATPAPV